MLFNPKEDSVLKRRQKTVLRRRTADVQDQQPHKPNDDLFGRLRPYVKVIIESNWNRKYSADWIEVEIGELFDLVKAEVFRKTGRFRYEDAMRFLAELRTYCADRPNCSPFHYFLFLEEQEKSPTKVINTPRLRRRI